MTTNGGDNWVVQNTGSAVELRSIDFANDTVGYAIGSTVVLKTTNGGIIFVNHTGNSLPAEYFLYQNYPNPFNTKTKIKYDVPAYNKRQTADVKIIIYDILGSEVAVLVNERLSPGSYEVQWNATNYPSGIYFFKLTSGEFSQFRKAVFIK